MRKIFIIIPAIGIYLIVIPIIVAYAVCCANNNTATIIAGKTKDYLKQEASNFAKEHKNWIPALVENSNGNFPYNDTISFIDFLNDGLGFSIDVFYPNIPRHTTVNIEWVSAVFTHYRYIKNGGEQFTWNYRVFDEDYWEMNDFPNLILELDPINN